MAVADFCRGATSGRCRVLRLVFLKRFIRAPIAVFTFCLTSALFQLVLTRLNTRTSYCVRNINLNAVCSEFLLTEDRQALGTQNSTSFFFFWITCHINDERRKKRERFFFMFKGHLLQSVICWHQRRDWRWKFLCCYPKSNIIPISTWEIYTVPMSPTWTHYVLCRNLQVSFYT